VEQRQSSARTTTDVCPPIWLARASPSYSNTRGVGSGWVSGSPPPPGQWALGTGQGGRARPNRSVRGRHRYHQPPAASLGSGGTSIRGWVGCAGEAWRAGVGECSDGETTGHWRAWLARPLDQTKPTNHSRRRPKLMRVVVIVDPDVSGGGQRREGVTRASGENRRPEAEQGSAQNARGTVGDLGRVCGGGPRGARGRGAFGRYRSRLIRRSKLFFCCEKKKL